MLNTDLVKEYLEAVKAKGELEASLRTLAQRVGYLESQVVEMMLQAEVQNVKAASGAMVFLVHTDKVYAKNKEELCKALTATGHGELVKADINFMRLNGWYNELAGDVPDQVREHLNITHEVRTRVRGA